MQGGLKIYLCTVGPSTPSESSVSCAMIVKIAFPALGYPDVDMLRCKELNSFATECVIPRRPKRGLPPLPEDKECSNSELKKCIKVSNRKRKHRGQCLILPSLKESDECNWSCDLWFWWNRFRILVEMRLKVPTYSTSGLKPTLQLAQNKLMDVIRFLSIDLS